MNIQSTTSTNQIPQSWIDALFSKMLSIYGNKFLEMWRGVDINTVKTIWAQELSKLSREEISKGANALMKQEWPPTLPQFIKLCRIEIDTLAAYYEAVNGVVAREHGQMGEWSHPAIFWASVKISAFDLKNQSYAMLKGRWETALESEIAKGQWPDIPKAQIALPAPPDKATKEIADKYLAETQIIKTEKSSYDHKLWAKKIMERHKAGDKTLTHIQISFAKEALENTLH